MADIIQLERDITAWVAAKLEMTIDTDIFRGGIPASAEGSKLAGVMILSKIPKVYPGLKDINCQVLGKFEPSQCLTLSMMPYRVTVKASTTRLLSRYSPKAKDHHTKPMMTAR